MLEFTLCEDLLPFNYFDEVGFDFADVAIDCIKKKYPDLSNSECESIFEENYDLFSEKMCELRDSDAIYDYCVGEEEIDEYRGTWGYFHYEIKDVEEALMKLEKEAKFLLEEVVNDIEL